MTDREIIQHGTFLSIFGVGTLLTGKPGIGKSELALALLYQQHQLIADDAPLFSRQGELVIGRNDATHLLSVRGIGLMDIPTLFGPESVKAAHPLELIIDLLQCLPTHALTHLEGIHGSKDILGCLIPSVTIPIITPRNLTVLVETIVTLFLRNCYCTTKDCQPA